FQFWFVFANRVTILNFHEKGYLPGRYFISGLVAGALIHWLYLLMVVTLKRFFQRYKHPRAWMLVPAVWMLASIHVYSIVRNVSHPPLTAYEGFALVLHLAVVHLITYMVGERT